jgi:kumamolisin
VLVRSPIGVITLFYGRYVMSWGLFTRNVLKNCLRITAAAIAMTLAASLTPLWAQIEVPDSTNELPADVGAKAHTNHLILLRPERLQRSRVTTPVGETPGSLACVYQTSTESLGTGCPITGKLANGNNGLSNASGGSQTIAIVDAYDYPTAYNDLSVFSNQFGLPVLSPCSGENATSCFQQIYASGSKPASNGSWALEAALDIEWAHAMAPGARIVLVEAASNSFADLFTAVDVASNEVLCGSTSCNGGSGYGEVSMSWGSSEFSGESNYDSHFQVSNVVYFAAAGDSGGKTIYPSASPYVLSAGGTSVNRNSSGDFLSETAWSSGGGGPSAYEPIPGYQLPVSNLVGTKRGTPDFSFDANPNTGVFVYDSTPYNGSAGWWIVGGTSVASPSLAGIVNLAGSFQPSSSSELGLIYSICGGGPSGNCSNANFRDVTSGSAGTYKSIVGWDFTTGVGSNQGNGGK